MSIITQNCCVREEWEKFIEGKAVDESKISPVIYDSWKRSRAYGVDPFKPAVPENLPTQVPGVAEVPVVLGNFLQHYTKRLAAQYGICISFFNSDGLIVADAMTEMKRVGNNSEHIIGTNSVGLALVHNMPSIVLGSEHYAMSFHDGNACAAPVHNGKGEIIGVINALVFDLEQMEKTRVLVGSMAEIVEMTNTLTSCDHNPLGAGFIEELVDALPQGLAYLDGSNEVLFYNERFLDMLKLNKAKDLKVEINRLMSMLSFSKGKQKRHASVCMNEGKTSFLVSTKDITSHDRQTNKLIVVEEGGNCAQGPPGSSAIYTFDDIVGNSKKLVDAKLRAGRVAQEAVSVLICGESGTGKELFAQAIHNASPRRNRPFVAVNCGAIPTELAESELFGYEPGSFTGALRSGKQGYLGLASGGTLFLDEIEEMPLNIQVKLLRVLSEGRLSKIGGTKVLPVDIRVISATKKDLLKEADCGAFREDLYYRISTVTIDLPPLRERKDDIPLLTHYIIAQSCKASSKKHLDITAELLDILVKYEWRGNVRELRNVIERAIYLLADGVTRIDANCLPDRMLKDYACVSVKEKPEKDESFKRGTDNLLRMGEEVIIRSVLEDTQYNYSRASKHLGITRKTLYNKIRGNENLSRGSRKR